MSISTSNYAQPVQVNGYTCKNCTDVDYAKRHIDPQHPKSGPYGVDAAQDPSRRSAVAFGGALAGLNGVQAGASASSPSAVPATGGRLDVAA